MRIALEHSTLEWNQHFIVREWVDIEPDMEFRGFVCNGQLNALSQYNFIFYSERLEQTKDLLPYRIKQFHDTLIFPKLKERFTQYVVDFAVIGEKLDRILVIELNPFLESTNAALFSWRDERKILENGTHIQSNDITK
jgi:hypothetical protein